MSNSPSENPNANRSGFEETTFAAAPMKYQKGGGNKTVIIIVLAVLGVLFLGGILTIGLLIALMLPAVNAARGAAQRMSDSNNMRIVSLGLLNYESAYRRLPSPAATNHLGEKVWSWRVSMLPFVEEVHRYEAIDFLDMQPWNSPKNSILQEESPRVFQSMRAGHAPGSNACNVFVISAPELAKVNPAFVEGKNAKIEDFTDGISNTIVAIMLVKHSVEWANPANLSMDEAYQLIQKEDKVFLAAFANGRVVELPTNIDRATFEALVTRDGGEVVDIPSD